MENPKPRDFGVEPMQDGEMVIIDDIRYELHGQKLTWEKLSVISR